mmetsp:Transcript_32898/g.104805  ORF Transcript_32898/g.104805 Transcript_32898/m.104805 type:complete len:213 (+) Transcript_32898:1267-1905(+)
MAAGSELSSPDGPTPTSPGGSGRPSRWCTSISPRAITLDAWSQTYGGRPPARGQPNAIGFVPKTRRALPGAAATYGGELWQTMETTPCIASCSAGYHMAPDMPRALATPIIATPCVLALLTSSARPAASAACAKPPRASTRTTAGSGLLTTGTARASTLPPAQPSRKAGSRKRPCELQPSSSAARSMSAMADAWRCEAPHARSDDWASSRTC